MKIAVAIFGIPRGSEITSISIHDKILKPLSFIGNVHLFGHLYVQNSVVNSRSNENSPLCSDDYERFSNFKPILEEPMKCLDVWNFESLKLYGDTYNDDFVSLRNLVHQLHSLFIVTKEIQKFEPDVVVFIRPDLLYHDEFTVELTKIVMKNPKKVFLPDWQWWNGYNDRFSICGSKIYQAYGRRIENLIDCYKFCEMQQIDFNSEKLLRYSLKRENAAVRLMKLKASRVRTGNVIHEEIFDVKKSMGNDSRKLKMEHIFLKYLTKIDTVFNT